MKTYDTENTKSELYLLLTGVMGVKTTKKIQYDAKRIGDNLLSVKVGNDTYVVTNHQIRTKNMGRKKTDLKSGQVYSTIMDTDIIQNVVSTIASIDDTTDEGSFVMLNRWDNRPSYFNWQLLVQADDLSVRTIKLSRDASLSNGFSEGIHWYDIITIIKK